MDRDVSPRIAFWTSSFQPDMEAVASEVACIRRHFQGSVAWGISQRDGWVLSRKRGFGVPPSMHLVFRAATAALQHRYDINHVFGGLNDWFHLRAITKRPIAMTLAVHGSCNDVRLLDKIDQFVVEWPEGATVLRQHGVDAARIRLIYPPVDLENFYPIPIKSEPFTALFASSPNRADQLQARGVYAILDAAAERPQIRFHLVWRPWGDSLEAVKKQITKRQLTNVELHCGRFLNMSHRYQQAHVTLAPFVHIETCKPTPNSLLESLACGRPVILSPQVGIADLVSEHRAGVVCTPLGERIIDALDEAYNSWTTMSKNARHLAETTFGCDTFLDRYRGMYDELI